MKVSFADTVQNEIKSPLVLIGDTAQSIFQSLNMARPKANIVKLNESDTSGHFEREDEPN